MKSNNPHQFSLLIKGDITLILVVFNGETTLLKTLQSIENQNNKTLIRDILIIDDGSTDNSVNLVQDYINRTQFFVKLIQNQQTQGLANSYNLAINQCQSSYFILMHQDIELIDPDSFTKIHSPLQDKSIIASYPITQHPLEIWLQYSFWQHCLFSRLVDRDRIQFTGKFDCINKNLLVQHIGLFDGGSYRSAGEDTDLQRRIESKGFSTLAAPIKINHLHRLDKYFPLKKWIHKEAQLAEAQGVLLRKYGMLRQFNLLTYFRPVLVIGLFIPYLQWASAILIFIYSFLYTKRVFLKTRFQFKMLVLPLINVSLLFIATFFTFKGFVTKQQLIR